MTKQLLSGLIAAPFTPFDRRGGLNLALIPDLAADLKRNQVTGAFVCGTTGEGSSLTTDERIKVAEKWVRTKPSGLSVIVHVGHNSLEDSAALARHAARTGADAFAMLSPSLLRPATLEDLVECCSYVARAAPKLPFYYYHMPSSTGVGFDMADFLRVAATRIPNLAGIKFTHEKLMDFAQALAVDPARYTVLNGRDEILIAGLAIGTNGAVGSTYNYSAPIYHRLVRAFAAGDMATARREQALAVRFIEIMVRHGGLAAGKSIMKLIGLDCGGVRLPLRSLTPATAARLKTDLREAGFFEAIRLPSEKSPRSKAARRSIAAQA